MTMLQCLPPSIRALLCIVWFIRLLWFSLSVSCVQFSHFSHYVSFSHVTQLLCHFHNCHCHLLSLTSKDLISILRLWTKSSFCVCPISINSINHMCNFVFFFAKLCIFMWNFVYLCETLYIYVKLCIFMWNTSSILCWYATFDMLNKNGTSVIYNQCSFRSDCTPAQSDLRATLYDDL